MSDHVDVVCVGGGGGGLAAAIAAAREGASVVVLEKRHALGGNSRVATGLFAVESRVQERLNIVTSRDWAFRVAADYAHWRINPRLLRAFIDRSADTIAWLEELGVDFKWIPPLFPDQFPPTWHVPAGGGPSMVDALIREAEARGVRLRTDASVESIQRTPEGAFEVEAAVGRLTARAVVIATGGFGGNQRMLAQYCPGYDPASWFCMGLRHMGDGIRIAGELGAAQDGIGLCEFEAPSVQGPLFLSLALREPAALIVNANGRRFLDESLTDNCFEAANALIRQPGQVAYGLLDTRLRDRVLQKAGNKALGPLYEDQMRDPAQFARLLDGVAGARGRVVATLDEAATVIGVAPPALHSTIARYNDDCRRGYDAEFGKNTRHLQPIEHPPFVVLRGTVGFLNTLGGLRTNERLEVIDAEGDPLRGLYVAGVDAGGWQGDTYNFRLAGSSLGFALNSGLIAGEHAAWGLR